MTMPSNVITTSPLTFSIEIDDEADRLDCAWLNPILKQRIESLKQTKTGARKLVNLKSVSDVNYGNRLPPGTNIVEDAASVIPFIRAADVKNLKVNWESAAKIPKEVHKIIQSSQIRQNDIVITIVGTIGEVGLLQDKIEVCDVSDNVARIQITDPSLIPEFLLFLLSCEYTKAQTERFIVGSLQYKLSIQSCRNIDVYIPYSKKLGCYDIREQKQILNKVHRILEESQRERNKGSQLIEESRTIVTDELGVKLPEGSGKTEIFNLELDEDGATRLDALYNNPLRYQVLKSIQIFPHKLLGDIAKRPVIDKIRPADYYRLVELEDLDERLGEIVGAREVSELGSEKITLSANTVIISRLQPEKGKVALVTDAFDGCAGSSELMPLSLNTETGMLEYLWAVLRSDYVLKQWAYTLTGSSRMRIGPQEIGATLIPIPSLKLQRKIASSVQKKISDGRQAFENAKRLQREAHKSFSESLFLTR